MHKILWLFIPVMLIIIQVILEITLPNSILRPLHGENGPVELLQFFVISAAFFVAISILFKMDRKKQKWVTAWISIAAICSFYVAWEEISWGQHILEWNTPEFWSQVNDQQETNLHNVSSWLDQKPRLLLEIGVLVGGLIIPALMAYKRNLLPERFTIIYPPAQICITAGIAVIVKVTEKVGDAMDVFFFERGSEIIEFYLFYFVLLYLLEMRKRLVKKEHA